jgi:predicted Fe-S protein YdhL (DUF1289 family)
MIQFRCRCSHPFTVPDSQAGESLQCPACGLLVDVPTLEQIGTLDDDGAAFSLRDEKTQRSRDLPNPGDTPHIVDRGDHKDRRLSLAEFLKIGTTDDDLLQIKDEVRPGVPKHPKYDPVTGELIIPLDIKRPTVVAQPMTAQPVVLGYEIKKDRAGPTIWSPFRMMFELPNVIVTSILGAMVCFFLVLLGVVAINIVLFALVTLVFAMPVMLLVLSHFVNVIDETGPSANDELPRPMRSANLYEDVIRPLFQIASAYLIAYLPIFFVNLYVSSLSWEMNLALLALLFVIVPAFLLTVTTSGAINNLLPHRALSVMKAAGLNYWIACAMGFVATLAALVLVAFCLHAGDALNTFLLTGSFGGVRRLVGLPVWIEVLATPLVVWAGLYLIQTYCWQLGILYRLHHERFNWVLQKHDKSERSDVIAQLHQHRQRDLEEKARRARELLEQRQRAAPGSQRPTR